MLNRIPSSRDDADNDMLPIAPTSSPTIGNTLVVGRLSPLALNNVSVCNNVTQNSIFLRFE